MSQLVFTNTALKGVNKVGTLSKDENGYYDVILGSLESPNSYGAIYKLQSAKQIFDQDSPFIRQVNKGMLFGEYGHPVREPGMNDLEWMSRVHAVREHFKSHHIKEVSIDENMLDRNGRKYIAIRGKVKPCGPYGRFIDEDMRNPDMAVSFSIRSITNDSIVMGRREKELVNVITWDYVNEPGLSQATKWDSPSLESYGSFIIDQKTLEKAINATENSGYGFESASRMRTTLNAFKASLANQHSSKGSVWMNW